MSQRVTTSFLNTNIPGAYFEAKVKSTPVGVGVSGNVVIVGEADGGAAAKSIDSANGDVLKDNFYTPDQLSKVISKYVSGPIVDAFAALSVASSDPDITGSPSRIYISKTNSSSKASAVVATAYGSLKDRNFGLNGNKYSFQVSQADAEVAPEVTSGVILAFGVALDGLEFKIRVDGGAESTITLGTGTHADIATLVSEIDALLPAALSCTAGTLANTLKISYNVDAAANTKGNGKSFELVDSTPGDLAAIELDAGLITSSQEPSVELEINRVDTGVNESFIIDSEIALEIGYEGTTATATITDSVFTTAVTGGAGSALSINLSEYVTISELASYIASQAGYSCSANPNTAQKSPVSLDNVSAVGICSSAASLKAGRIKKAAESFSVKANQSPSLEFEATATKGLPIVQAKTFLSGGSKGATTAANVVSASVELETISVNFVVPLFSRDASEDISESLTDSSSTYTIDAVNAIIKSHVLKMSTAKIKKHRSAVLSAWASFADIKAKSGTLAHPRISLVFQKTSSVNSAGQVVNYQPWHTACIAAGMQVAGFYKSICNKFANIINFTDPSGFDSGSPGDLETALDAGLLFLEKSVVGSKWVSDQTTYGVDTNFVYNSVQAMYSADLVSLDLTDSLQRAFVGKSLADVDPATVTSFIASKMDSYKKQKLIAASDDAPLAYKNVVVSLNGPIMEVSLEIKLATAIYFIPINIEISQVKSSAEA